MCTLGRLESIEECICFSGRPNRYRIRHGYPALWRTQGQSEQAGEPVNGNRTSKTNPRHSSVSARGFSVRVSGRESEDDDVVVAADIATAVDKAVSLVARRHPGAMVTGVYHLGEIIS